MIRLTLIIILTLATASSCGGDDDPGQIVDASVADGSGGGDGRTGLEGFCDYYKECGGSYYGTAQICIDATLSYWGECRRDVLDTFGDCMMANVECSGWNPDNYNPANTPCSSEWSDVTSRQCAL